MITIHDTNMPKMLRESLFQYMAFSYVQYSNSSSFVSAFRAYSLPRNHLTNIFAAEMYKNELPNIVWNMTMTRYYKKQMIEAAD